MSRMNNSSFRWHGQVYSHARVGIFVIARSEEHTSELQSQSNLVCRLLLEKKKKIITAILLVPRDDLMSNKKHNLKHLQHANPIIYHTTISTSYEAHRSTKRLYIVRSIRTL